MLIENTLFGIEDKVQTAIDDLNKYEPKDGYYLCFSGGKDSVVIYDLAKKAGVNFTAYHNITTVEPPELMQFICKQYPDVKHNKPRESMHKLIVRKGILPLRHARYCCSELKEGGGTDRVKITGVRAEESARRAKRKKFELDRRDKSGKGAFLHVIRDWTAKDVWSYIKQNNIPYCSLYDEGFNRIGCVLCPFISYEKAIEELTRFPAVADYYRRACNAAIKRLAEKGKLNTDKFSTGEEMFNWWIESRKKTRIIDDCDYIPLFSEDDDSIL